MYEIVTRHDNWGDITLDAIEELIEDINRFVDENPEMGLRSYSDVLEEYGLEWSPESMENADYMKMDGRGIMALLVGAYRGDYFCNGLFDEFIRKGIIQNWIARLKEIDERGE